MYKSIILLSLLLYATACTSQRAKNVQALEIAREQIAAGRPAAALTLLLEAESLHWRSGVSTALRDGMIWPVITY